MKLLTTYEAKNAFPRVLKLSRREVVIVTKDLLEHSPKFWAMIRRARRGRGVSLAQVRKRVGLRKR